MPIRQYKNMQLRFTHRALQSEHKPIVEAARVVGAVLIQDGRPAHRARLDQTVPIGGVAGEARDFQAHHDARFIQSHFAHELLEAVAVLGTGSGLSQVTVDDVNALQGPAVDDGAFAQCILQQRAPRVVNDLACSRLANVRILVPFQMRAGDIYVRHEGISLGVRINWARGCASATRVPSSSAGTALDAPSSTRG